MFQLDNGKDVDSSLLAEINCSDDQLPQCSVCLDGAGDIVLLPCSHGGLCEECARHIARNMAVGGAHCPRCREPIERVVRISNLQYNVAHATELVFAPGEILKAPPKVPPPPGQKKNKATAGALRLREETS